MFNTMNKYKSIYTVKTPCGEYQVYLQISCYVQNPQYISILLMDIDPLEGPYAHLTINVENVKNFKIKPEFGFGFLDTEICPWSEEFVINNSLATPVLNNGNPIIIPSGFCAYPLYKFNVNKLMLENKTEMLLYKEKFDNFCN